MSRAASLLRLLPFVLAAGLLVAVPSPASAQQSLQLDGVNDYVTFGAAPGLGSTTFTIEVAFKRTAAGVTASTGTGGVTAVPLITKGRGEADGANTDMNWFLGINAANQLTADYEEGAGQASPGLNHPVTGTTMITNNVWHHAAAVFDGTTWSLYLDGNLDATLVVGAGRLPRFDSIQHAALGSALTSTGVAAGFFAGLLDEARVWNVARTQAQIQAGIGAEVLASTGLLGRWGLNEGAGTGAGNSVASGVNGTLTNGPVWSADSNLPLAAASGIRLGGANAYVALGSPASLQLSAFTIELWIRRDGAGAGTNTGSGGIPDAIPLVAKGRAEAETATQDINYLFGIRASDGVLCGDFEEGAGGASPSLNHPVAGVTPITTGVWHHVAATYDGTAWKLYLDGALEASLAVGRPLASASVSPVAIGSALTSVSAAAGFFDGAVDEVRIWNVARTQAEIAASANAEIMGAASGLVGRWGMNEDQGAVVGSTAGTTLNGTLTGTAWSWAAGSPFNAATPVAPSDPTGLIASGVSPTQIDLSWTDNASNETGYEVQRSTTGSGGPYTPLVTLPANATSTSDPSLSPATEYCYRVRAVNGVGPSGYAPVACATTQSVPPPADPTNLIATAMTPVQIDLAWTDNATDETGYEVERSSTGAGGPFAPLVALPANAVSYSNIGLAASAEYCYRVRAVNGALASGYAAVACATTLAAPSAPSGLTAAAVTSGQVHLAWTDLATDETGYAVERSTAGAGGPFAVVATLAANAGAWDDLNRDANTEFCYRVRALGVYVPSAYSSVACATTPTAVPGSLDLAGSTYVTFGDPNALDLAAFTLECWFRRDGAGTTTTTGAGGIPAAIPLITHGAPEADNSNVDMNYFLGIRSDGVLCADFEEGPAGPSPGLNHPVAGTTSVAAGSGWHHAAATYDGASWNLYLDGNLEATLAVGRPVRSNSIQRAALGTALTSTGATNGFFDGAIDEARVWSVARTQSEIQATANAQLAAAQAGLAARWSLDEGSGTVVNASAGTEVPGTITGSNYAWSGPAPFSLSFSTPDAPSGLQATAPTHAAVLLTWNDQSNNESSFQIERSTSGSGGPFTPLATVAANTTSYADVGLDPATGYCYRVRAVNGNGASAYGGPACATTPFSTNTGLDFGNGGYASFGNASALQLSTFTIEMWMRRDGAGTGTNTGTGGIPDLIPLFARGRAEAETATQDINYIFGIRASDNVLCADFEEGAAGASPSLNHPIAGATPIGIGSWHHVAATYDGSTWKLYLDGNLDASLTVGQPVAAASTVAASLASALLSTGAAAGFFDGAVDEVRVWNVARTQDQIQSTANVPIDASASGLVARWSLDEGWGPSFAGSAGTSVNGTLMGSPYAWDGGAPFDLALNHAPGAPVAVAPANGATGVSTSPTLTANVTDPDGNALQVAFYGRAESGTPGPDFTIIGIPDTQYYTGQLNGGTNAIFQSQTNWIVANKDALHIAYVATLGDCVEHGDNSGNDIEWQRADASYSIIEDPVTTGLLHGIPYGVTVGNHDQSPIGNPDGTTTFYNQHFGSSRFSGRSYYGGHYGANNDNWYDLFSAGGMDFLVISLEYDPTPDPAIMAWADNLLTTYASRKAILLSHFIANTGNPAGFGPQGQAIYDAFKGHANVSLLLCGHVPGEGRRQDTYLGNTIHTLMADYQGRTNGGNGWLRILQFSPANNTLRVRTYSPLLDQYEADADSSSQFTLTYPMTTTPAFALIGTTGGVMSGGTASVAWPGRTAGTTYEWYATANDGAATTVGTVSRFSTAEAPTYTLATSVTPAGGGAVTRNPNQASYIEGSAVEVTAVPSTGYHFVNWTGDLTGSTNPQTIAMDANKSVTATFAIDTYTITATAGAGGSITPSGAVTVNYGADQAFTITPDVGHHLVDVKVDGSSIGAIASYTFGTVTAAHTIEATFAIDTYTITATAGAGGSITPPGAVTVNFGADQAFAITPDVGHHLVDVKVDGGSIGAVAGYTFSTVTAAHTIEATFAIDTYTITATAGAGGSISPSGDIAVNFGADQAFTIAPSTGYHIASVLVDGASVGPVGSYTFSGVTAGHTIAASFAANTFTITASSGPGGAISPSGDVGVSEGEDKTFTITPATGYHIADVLVDGASVGAVASFTFQAIAAGHTIAASFALDTFTITASAGSGGAIDPSGSVTVAYGSDRAFTIAPSTGYHIADVLVDGTSIGAVGTYTFTAVTAGHTVAASFAIDTFTITASAGSGGAIDPSGSVTVGYGSDQTFTITPTLGYHIADVLVDGTSIGAMGTYTFTAVAAGHTIAASFALDTFTIAAFAGPGGAIDPSGDVAVGYGLDRAFTITPNAGYHVADVLVDGSSVGPVSTYTFTGVTGDHSIAATFAINTYTITASAGPNGSIAPSGATTLNYGDGQSYTITADPGYHVLDVLVDGGSVGAVTTYAFAGVAADHTIAASFEANFDALDFAGTNAYASFGNPAELKLSAFTIEMWMRRDGTGAGTNTGTGGIADLVPLFAKGRAEAEDPLKDINYIFGVQASTGVLGADFEEAASPSPNPSLNHPVLGTTPLTIGTWYHVAATYDGSTWRLYVNGAQDAELAVGRAVAVSSNVAVSLASALNSTNQPAGFFDGRVDEVRVWSTARTATQIASTIDARLTAPAPGLVARWGMDEGTGAAIQSMAGTALSGTLTGSGYAWSTGAPYDVPTFTVTAAAGPGGGIDPSGAVPVIPGSTPSFTITPDACHDIADVMVDGASVGAVGSYTFPPVSASAHSITASFSLRSFAISASAGPNGTVSPAGSTLVGCGSDQGYTIAADAGYHVADVLVDGASVGAVGAYTFTGVTASHTIAAVFAANGDALALAGTNGYVLFGNPPELKLNAFTIEMWVRRDGTGVGTNTGAGGIADLVPLFSKGRADVEDPLRDINYIVGVQASTGVLAADFEEAAAPSPNPSLNHPVLGATPLTVGTWYHVAATYDGSAWRLYVNGRLDAQLAVGRGVASASDAPVALGTAMTTAVPAAGFFQGVCDEVRIWSVARTPAEILATINDRIITPATGLVARWGLDEGTGTLVQSTAGVPLDGTVTGSGFNWTTGAPFNAAPPTPPALPSNLTAEGVSAGRIDLTWTDGSDNESGFEIERSTSGSGGPFAPLITVAADATTYSNTGLAPATEYCYRIRAVNGAGSSSYDGPVCTSTEATPAFALAFNGSTYVNFGDPAALDLPQFTIETWFRRDGAGTTASTGSGGVTDAIPLVTHGTSQADGSNVDMNFFLGIKSAGSVLCADFEEGAGGASPGLNHPILGVTPITNGVWYHAAATYDGATWKLYLNGNLESQLAVGQPVQSASIQLAALASSITSTGTAQGFFVGALDETRIWNAARTQADIQGAINAQIAAPAAGLVARWALDEGSGTAVGSSAGTSVNGTISGTAYTWVAGAPFNLAFNLPPTAPLLVGPADQAADVGLAPTLQVSASDPDGQSLTVQFYGRSAVSTPGSDFTIVGMPDTQYYTGELNGGTNAILLSQTSWITANRASRNIGYVATLGDCVEHGDNGGNDIEWQHADAGYSLIENPGTTGLPEGLPYGITVGNHDQSPNGNPDGATTVFYNQYFGSARFTGRSYYGGHYGSNNDNWYNLFSAGGMDFVVISLEYDTTPDAAILDWADGLLTTYANRRAILLSHNFIGTGNPGAWSAQGQATYDRLKTHTNLFLMLCGHVPGEGRRVDTFNGNTVYTVMSDYQGRTNGGNGWLRLMQFSPSNNVIHVTTYSPWLDQTENDADSQFDIPYSMSSAESYALLGTVPGVMSGSTASLTLAGLAGGTPYQWYVTVSDGVATATGPTWGFTTHAITGVEEQPVTAFSMRMTSSNPTSSGASIAFDLPRPERVQVELFDAAGRLVATLANAEYPTGRHSLRWEGRTAHGQAPSGVYFVRFRAPGHALTRRFVLLR